MAQKPKPNDKSQVRRFRKAARELGCDESEERFQDALRQIATPRTVPSKDGTRKAEAKRRD